MPGLAGQIPDYRGVKIVTGGSETDAREPDSVNQRHADAGRAVDG